MWTWIVGSALFAAVLGAILCFLLLMGLAYLQWRVCRTAIGCNEWLELGILGIGLLGLYLGAPVGAITGGYWAFRHPEYLHLGGAAFTVLGGLTATPLLWAWWQNETGYRRLRYETPAAYPRRNPFFDPVAFSAFGTLSLLVCGLLMGGWRHLYLPAALLTLERVGSTRRRQARIRRARERELGRFPLPGGEALVIQSIDWRPAVDDFPRGPTIYWRVEGERHFDFTTVLSDAEDPGTRVVTQGGGTGSDDVGRTIHTWSFVASPRRARTLRCGVHLRTSDGWMEVASLSFPNPDPGPHPEWTPPELPLAQRAGEVAVILHALEAVPPPDGDGRCGPLPGVWSRAVLEITGGARPETWQVRSVEIADATGNRFGVVRPSQELRDGRLEVYLETSHGVVDPVWKLGFELERTCAEGADEEWTLKGIQLPARNAVTPIEREKRLGEYRIRVIGVYGKEARLPAELTRAGRSEGPDPELAVRIDGPPAREPHLLLSDGRGWHDDRLQVSGIAGTSRLYLYRIGAPPGTGAVEVTFTVPRLLQVEFLAARKPDLHGPP